MGRGDHHKKATFLPSGCGDALPWCSTCPMQRGNIAGGATQGSAAGRADIPRGGQMITHSQKLREKFQVSPPSESPEI